MFPRRLPPLRSEGLRNFPRARTGAGRIAGPWIQYSVVRGRFWPQRFYSRWTSLRILLPIAVGAGWHRCARVVFRRPGRSRTSCLSSGEKSLAPRSRDTCNGRGTENRPAAKACSFSVTMDSEIRFSSFVTFPGCENGLAKSPSGHNPL